MSLRFEKVTACENETAVCWEWRMTGERKSGETVDTPGMSITEIADGKIVRNRDYWSTLPGRMSGE